MAGSASRQDESNPALWLVSRAGKMEQCCPLGITPRCPFARHGKFNPRTILSFDFPVVLEENTHYNVLKILNICLRKRKGAWCAVNFVLASINVILNRWVALWRQIIKINFVKFVNLENIFFSEWHRHTRKKKFRVLPTGVEPTTFRLLVWTLFHWATGVSSRVLN